MFSHRTSWKLTHNALTRAIEEAREADANLLDLTTSNPTRAGLKYDAENLLGAFSNDKALDYDPQSKGLLSAREAVAEYYRQEHDIFQLDPERIILTTSTSEAYSYIFRLLCNADDEILVPKPSYPLFEFLADLQDVRLIPYPLLYDHGWQIDFPSLYKSVTHRTRAVVVVHPNNPTGSFVRGEEVSALSGFCKEYGLAIIADEVFLDYALDGAPRTSFAKERRSVDVCFEWCLKGFRSAANEACVDGRKRSAGFGDRRDVPPGDNRRYVSIDERANPACGASLARPAEEHSAASAGSDARKLAGARPGLAATKKLPATCG
jgi:aspartate/methionine/tyrosine aminotransferase